LLINKTMLLQVKQDSLSGFFNRQVLGRNAYGRHMKNAHPKGKIVSFV
jgi:hypothetical protein